MKKLTIALASAAALLAGPALAADLAVRPVAKAPAYVPPPIVNNWSGFYIGIHGGGGWADSNYFFPTAGHYNLLPGDSFTHGISGGIVGGHVGFNMQWNQIVLGLEGSGAWADIKGTATSPFFPLTDTFRTRIDSIYTLTGRLGFAAGPALFYVKGGAAWGHINTRIQDSVDFNERSETKAGWTVGGGIEYMFANSWVIGVEGNYYDFDICCGGNTQSLLLVNGAPAGVFSNHDTRVEAWSVVGRLSYKFGGFAAPVAASY